MFRGNLRRTRVWLATLAVGGAPLALQGCDVAVRDIVLGGVQSAANGLAGTFIDAYFESLNEPAENPTTL
ncbi:MAG: hypothetical protein IPM64_13870 [Phycisphaerales bacterium]|nr:hypothetical protein [Phycisphaerales bacterium]